MNNAGEGPLMGMLFARCMEQAAHSKVDPVGVLQYMGVIACNIGHG